MSKPRETWHVAKADDDFQSIAAEYGIKDWEAVENDPQNQALLGRDERNAHVLYEGDKIWIPDVAPKVFDAETNKKHEYKIYRPMQLVHIVLEDDDGKAYGECKYEFWIDEEQYIPPDSTGELRTRKDGLIHQLVPLVKEIEIRAWLFDENATPEAEALAPSPDDPEEFDYISIIVYPAHLDPIDTVEGQQDRLANLGYQFADAWGTLGDGTKDAIREFQGDAGLTQTGEMDSETRKRLLEKAGS